MRVMITGGAGFIGSHLADYHLSQGDSVHVLDNLSTGRLENIANFLNRPNFNFEQADILTISHLEESVAKADLIYHLAAVVGVFRVLSEPISVLATNMMGCNRLLRAITNQKSMTRLIIASSSSVYGHSTKSLLSERNDLYLKSANHALRYYAVSKIADEALALAYYQEKKIPVTVIRLFNTIGPKQVGQYGMVVPRFIKQACLNLPISIFGDGTQTRSFCDVRDAVVLISQLAANTASIGEIVNVGNPSEITINALAILIKRLADSQSEIVYQSYLSAYGQALAEIKQRCPDLTKLSQLVNINYQWPLERTIKDLITLFRQKNLLESNK